MPLRKSVANGKEFFFFINVLSKFNTNLNNNLNIGF